MKNHHEKTAGQEYTQNLVKKQMVWWKRVVDVQTPYRWNLQRLNPGFTLDIGCGIGRNLNNLDGQGVGVDHNQFSVEISRQQGFIAFTPEEFRTSDFNLPERFDSILLAHVTEHMTKNQSVDLLKLYLPNLKAGGKVIIITPQEAGYKSDSTHVEFMGFHDIRSIIEELNLNILQEFSFPFPRFVGRFFLYNEFVSVSRKA